MEEGKKEIKNELREGRREKECVNGKRIKRRKLWKIKERRRGREGAERRKGYPGEERRENEKLNGKKGINRRKLITIEGGKYGKKIERK